MRLVTVIAELLRNFVHGPMTIRFPYESIPIAEGYRGQHRYDIEQCISCGLCARVCPNKAIEMIPVERSDGSEKSYPKIDMSKCCFCGLCEDICPKEALTLTQELPVATLDPDSLVIHPSASDAAE